MEGNSVIPRSGRLRSSKNVGEETIFTKRRRISERLMTTYEDGGKDFREYSSSISLPPGKVRKSSIATVILGLLIISSFLNLTLGHQHVFSNQFAVHIPAGDHKADEIAKKHNCDNLGQIGSLSEYYLFEARRVRKRSVSMDDEHHELFENEKEVLWFEQQVQKKRVKRDFSYFEVQQPGSTPGFYSAAQSFHPSPAQPSQNRFPDPLYPEQWYLTSGSKDGFDMNVQTAWKKGFTGKGVTVSILDDGIQTNHPDLLQNYDARASTDINDNDSDPMPQDNGDNKHGTRCAGEVAATAGNSICGVGVAYNASIGGVRMLDGTVNDAVEAKALGLNPDHIDIYSASWGPEDDGKTVDGPGPLARRAFIYGVSNGRRGLGSIFIWASGNGGRHVDSCNCDGYTNSIFTLSISSATQGGFKPWYLEECSSTLATTYSSGTPTLDKSVATVDMDARLRPDHICTVEHTGTSASAPLAAGIAALALEANKNLSWRDLQHLVVISSRPNPLEKEEGWYVNGVQRKFSHKFGYGLMDAGAMVDLAVTWAPVPPQHICKSREIREDREIPGAHLGKVKVFMDVDGCAGSNSEIRFLEHVQCKISLRFFPRGNLRIQLTSPMGTTSVLLFERPRDVSSSNFDDWPFLSVHFWGEQAHGRWTLEIINSGSRRINQSGILKKWQLILYGTDVNPVRVRTRSLQNPQFQPQQPFPSNLPPFQQTRRPFEPQPHHQQFRHPQPIATREHVPAEFLYPGASETVSQLQKQPSVRDQCQNEYWVPDLSICVHDCPEGYYANDTLRRECSSCPSRCKACYNSSTCTACEHNLVLLDQSCVPSCPEGYFEGDSTCKKCLLSTCSACTDPMGRTCVGCKDQMLVHEGGCVPHCPGGFRPTAARECAPCPSGCQSCDANTCLKCFDRFTFADDGICADENPVCPSGLYLDNETNQCKGCGYANCIQCDGIGRCLECDENLFLENGICVTVCSDGFYSGYNGKHCLSCPSLCRSCSSAEECTECTPDGNLQGTKCLPHCLDGYYTDKGTCRRCSSGCRTCVAYGDSECITCNAGYEYTRNGGCSADTGFTVILKGVQHSQPRPIPQNDNCGAGFWLNSLANTCQPCHRSCSNCSGGNPYNCKSCVHPLKFDRGTSRCIQCCHNANNEEDCCNCDAKRHIQREETPLTRGYDGECHFLSRRVSDRDEETIPVESHGSTLLGLFWLSVMSLIVMFIVVIHQRRRRRKVASSAGHGSDEVDFKCRKVPECWRKYDALYTPVSLSPCDDDDARSSLVGQENLDSDDEERIIRKASSFKNLIDT